MEYESRSTETNQKIFQKENIFCTLVNKERNEELLKSVPNTPFWDMAVIYHYLVEKRREGIIRKTITNKMLTEHGIDRAPLYMEAVKNTARLFQPRIYPMDKLIDKLISPSGISYIDEFSLADEDYNSKHAMFVLTNECSVFGAAILLYPDVIEGIARKLQSSIFILPSSIHEIIITKDEGMTLEQMTEMVRDVNRTSLEESDILSNHAFWYKYENGKKVGELICN